MNEEVPKIELIKEAPKPRVIQLDQVMLMRFELLAVKKKLNTARQQNLELTLLDLKREAKQLDVEEGKVLAEVFRDLGIEGEHNLRLVDPAKGLCAVE